MIKTTRMTGFERWIVNMAILRFNTIGTFMSWLLCCARHGRNLYV